MTSENGSPPSESNADGPLAANVRLGHEQGWSFTPLAGKRPTLEGWQKRPRETLEEALAWAAQGNVGLRTGKASAVVVIDVDPGGDVSGLELPGTVTALTGRPGAYHLYYLCDRPLGNSSGKLGPHIDVKADGGQVVFPGSVHPDTGAPYTWAEGHEPWNVEVAPLPEPVYEKLTAPKKPGGKPKARASAAPDPPAKAKHYALTAMKMELNAVRTARAGSRNQTLNRSAFSLGTLIGGGYLGRAEVEEALMAAAEACGLIADPDDGPEITRNTIHSGIEAGMREPRRIDLKGPPPGPNGALQAGDYILTPGPHKDDQGNHTERSNADFAGEALSRLPADAVYRRDFIAGEIVGPRGKRKWVEFSADRMRIVADTHVKLGKWVTSRKSKEQVLLYQASSKDHAGLVIAHAQNAPGVRDLHLMVAYPVYGLGFDRVPPGWHDGLYYDQPDDLRGLTAETDCEVIHNVLHDLVVDFPFKTPADRENFFGLLLTPIVAPAIDGNRPMHLLNAPIERTGKSKLPTTANPEARTDFQHPDIRSYARQRRRCVLECLLGLVENWLAAGRPAHANRLGGFESWSETVGGILQVNGLRAWRTNEAGWRERANPGGSEMEAFVKAWHEAFGYQEVQSQDLREMARSSNLFGHIFAKRADAAINVAFGRMLSRHTDTPVASSYIRRAGASNHVKYHLEEIK